MKGLAKTLKPTTSSIWLRPIMHEDKRGINFDGEKRRGMKGIQAVGASRSVPGGGGRVHWAQRGGSGAGAGWELRGPAREGRSLYCFKNTCRCCPTDTNSIVPQPSELLPPTSVLLLTSGLYSSWSSSCCLFSPLRLRCINNQHSCGVVVPWMCWSCGRVVRS